MLEKTGCFAHQYINELHGRPQEFFQGGQYRHFAYRFAENKWTFIKRFIYSILRKIPHGARAAFASFLKLYSGGSIYEFAKRVHFLSSATAFAELTYNPVSLSLRTADNSESELT